MSSLKPKVASLSANVELLTAIANDIGTDRLFSFQLESLGSQGDVLVAISSSGESPNIISALETARSQGLHSISLTGFAGGGARTLADVNVHVDCDNYGIVEDLHQSLMHILAQYLRHRNLDKPESLGSLKF
jgi:phosphoheptose isomerase